MLRRCFRTAHPPSLWLDRLPIHSELFGIERLEEHARSLAAAQAITARHVRGPGLSGRLAENAGFLLNASRALAPGVSGHQERTPAAEWLIDNYHLVEVQIREIGIDLPPSYYAQLPKLAKGPFAGLPRVFGAMWSLVAHTDSHIEPNTLSRYLLAYQGVEALTIGELWAVPITLRIVLIENLRRIAVVIVDNAAAREMADGLADRLLGFNGHVAAPWGSVSALFRPTPSPDAFAVQLAHRLRGRDPAAEPALAWLNEHLANRGVRIDAVVHDELQQQGTFTATIRNIITSLRMAAALDWSQVFETVSPVDAVLDRTGRFYEMDFTTRTLYRSAIEQLARHSPLSETEVANRAVALAADAAATHAPGDRRCDPGYYLLAGGTSLFETAIGFQPPLSRRMADAGRALGLVGYGAGFVTVAALFVAGPLWALAVMSDGVWWLLLLELMGFVPASEAAIACVNRFSMWALGATSLPGLELSAGIPPALRTMVAVPALLTSLRAVDELVARLEIHHLASPDGEVQFALLSDWTDSTTEHAEDDETLLNAAVQGVEQLNARYRPDTSAPGSAATASSCCIVAGSGTRARPVGWVGNASAASCMN